MKLTRDVGRRIVAFIEAGAFDYVAAESAGVPDRTFRDWIARGEGRHPSRRKTPELAAFAAEVREAKARARASREIVVADKDPKFWLQYAARSKPGREGWTDPIDAPDLPYVPDYEPNEQELAATVAVLVKAGVLDLAPCGDPDCRCAHHGGSGGAG